MASKFKIGTKIREWLLASSSITEKVGDKIYPILAPLNTTGSFIIYQRDEYSKDYTKFGVHSEKRKVFITVVSETYDESQEIAELLNNELEGLRDGFTIRLIDSTEEAIDNKFLQVLLFQID